MEKLALQVNHLILFIWFRRKGWFKGFTVIKYTYVACFKVAMRSIFAIYDLFIFMVYWPEAYSEPCQTSKIELFAKIVNEWKLLTIFKKSSILDVWQGSDLLCQM